MKKLYLSFITLLCSLISFGQTLEWMDTVNYTKAVSIVGIIPRSPGTLAVGSFGATVNQQNYGCMFRHSYNLQGQKIFSDTIHRKRLILTKAVADLSGNYYVLARYEQDSGITNFGTHQLNGKRDFYFILIKYSLNNQVLWVKRLTNASIFEMKYSRYNNTLYFSGHGFLDTLYFDNQSLTPGGFIANYDLNGNCTWVQKLSNDRVTYFDVDGSNNIYAINNNGTSNYFITKFDQNLNILWNYYLTNTPKISVDSMGNCYMTGPRYANSGIIQDNYFLEKLSPSGALEWSIKSNFGGVGQALFINDSGYIYAGGNYGSGNHHSDGMGIAKYDANGNEVWHYQLPDLDPNINNKVSKITEKDGAVYVGGQLSQQYPKGFVLKLHEPGVTTAIHEPNHLAGFSIYPNPGGSEFTFHYKNEKSKDPLFIYVRSITGQLVYTQTIPSVNGELREVINIGSQAKGNYFIELRQGEAVEVRKLVVQ